MPYKSQREAYTPIQLTGISHTDTRQPHPNSELSHYFQQLGQAFEKQDTLTQQRRQRIQAQQEPVAFQPEKPALESQPMAAPQSTAAPFQKSQAIPSQYPYETLGQAVQPASDRIRKEVVDPLGTALSHAVANKQPVTAAEPDLINMAGAITRAAGQTYTADNHIAATDAIHQGKTEGNETTYSHPARAQDVLKSLHAGDTDNFGETMANQQSQAHKGYEKSLREINLSLQEVRLMGNKLIDPEGKYIDTQGLQNWVDSEKRYLHTIQLPELLDFTKLDWKKNPDKFIELGGKYFRPSLLGSHLFGYAVDAIKGQGGAGEFFSTVVGIARFYNQTDKLMESILAGGTLASASIGWNRLVDGLSTHLPLMSRQALLLANSVMSEEVKARAFEWMKNQFNKTRRTDVLSDPNKNPITQGKCINATGQGRKISDPRKAELEPITIRDRS